jgi:nitrite reductase (NADH) large subunit
VTPVSLRKFEPVAATAADAAPIVVVGAGPVGIRVTQELIRRMPAAAVVLYGEEASEPYNRVRLSSFLGGELSWQGLTRDLTLPSDANIITRYGCAVAAIDRVNHCVRDATGCVQSYSKLVLATGSRPYVPDVPGMKLPGVYTFRDVRDANRLIARRVRSRRTIVLGGGLLGLEAARAMQRFNTGVWVVEHYRLMMQQLDESAAFNLSRMSGRSASKSSWGMSKHWAGQPSPAFNCAASSARMHAAGRHRHTAQHPICARLHVGHGVRVNDNVTDPDVYGSGNLLPRDRVCGIVAPGSSGRRWRRMSSPAGGRAIPARPARLCSISRYSAWGGR